MFLSINNIACSLTNGPGNRLVIWVQGCKLNCKNCFNPETHSYNGGSKINLFDLASNINNNKNIEGVTFSGGEPLDYSNELISLIGLLNPELTKIIYTGYTIKEIMSCSERIRLINMSDLIISGRYNHNIDHPFYGKKIMAITDRVDYAYFAPKIQVEYNFSGNKVTKTGIFK